MNSAVPSDLTITVSLERAAALNRAWAQVHPEELSAALRLMPPKLRNRLLSAHRTPSSKVTAVTARLLVTNLGRGNFRDRLRAADFICSPFIHRLGDVIDEAPPAAVLAAVKNVVDELSDDVGASMVVLAITSAMTGEPGRFAPALIVAADEGLLTPELAAVAAEIRPVVLSQLEEAEGEDGDDDPTPSSGHVASALEDIRVTWQAAVDAAERTAVDVVAGRAPSAGDLDAVRSFGDALNEEAARLGTEPLVEAVVAATEATLARQSAFELSQRLRSLAGPPTLADEVAALHDAAAGVEDDPTLAERLSRFLDIFDTQEPLERFGIASELRTQPSPPDPSLIDAALAGLLTLEDVGPVVATPPAREEVEDTLVPSPQPQDAVVVEQSAAAEPAPPVLERGHEALTEDLGYETPPERASLEDSRRADADGETEDRPLAITSAAAPADEPVVGDQERSGAAAARAVTGQAAADRQAAAAVEEPDGDVETDPAKIDEDELEDDEVAAALTDLVRARRFGLAHHLARALGHDYRAEILAEAALGQAVRTTSSAAAGELVARVGAQPLNLSDTGSVALRAAATTRVALLDPSSTAPAILRQVLPALGDLPRLREFVAAVASATEKNLVVPAAGVALDASESHAQAQAIASWADDFLRRPPRQNRLYRGVEIWKQWMSPTGLVGSILSIVAQNDATKVDDVRNACQPLNDHRRREEIVESTDKHLREGRAGHAQKIVGPAREQLLRGLEEVIEQAQEWCDCHAAAPGGRTSELRDDLARRVIRLRHVIPDELAAASVDDWSAAAAEAAGAMVDETIGLLCNEPLPGVGLTPNEALNRGLALVDGLRLDVDLQPLEVPTARQLIEAAGTPRTEAFAARLAAGDFAAAEAIIDLSVGSGDGFDEAESRQELRSRERDESARVQALWSGLDGLFAAARTRGRINEEDASTLHAMLLQAQPRSAETGNRRDLGRVEIELEAIANELEEASASRRQSVTADVADAIDSGEFDPAWTVKLADLLDRDELGSAEEYLHRARAGEDAPDAAESAGAPDDALADVLRAAPEGVTPEVVEAARVGAVVAGLDFGGIPELNRPSISAALDAWRTLKGGERSDAEQVLEPVLRLLGVIPTKVERPNPLRQISTKGRWFVDVLGDRSGYAYAPDFGSRAAGRRRFMLCWDDLPVSQMWDLAAANSPADQPVYVLRMGTLGPQARVELARHARLRDGDQVVVIDEAVILRCALAGRQSYDITMRAVLPYAAPNPYDPDLLTGMPEEMFYGRRSERQKIAAPAGSSFISGGRRLGKTALLRSVQAELKGSDVLSLLIVIQHVAAVPPSNPAELWPVLAARLIEADVLPSGTDGTADAVSGGVRAWLADNPGRRLLLLLDECDFFLRADAASSFANVVRLRDLMQDGDGRFKVVFSGLQHVARYRKLPNQPLSHLPQPLVIGPLDAASAAALVRRPLHALGWNISDAQVDRLVTFCACNPSVVQLACSQLLDRLRAESVETLAPWAVPDQVLNELLRSSDVEQGVRHRLFLTLELDHRYKLLAYLLAWRAVSEGLAATSSPTELRVEAMENWPEGFAGQNPDDVRALCDELVGLGVFAGKAETGYRMLSPATVRLFGSIDEITDELISASGTYEPDAVAGAAGNRMALGEGRFSPLTAAQLADVVGAGATQLRVIVGSRALRAEAVAEALAVAARNLPGVTTSDLTGTSRRQWQEAMTAPTDGHIVVVSDMTVGRSTESWAQSIEAAHRRGHSRTAKGTRAAVLVAGPSERWLLRDVVTTTDGRRGPLADVAVGLRRVDMPSLRAWDRIEELDLAHPARQQRLLTVTGGWPMLIERLISRMRQRPFDDAADELEAYLAESAGAMELLSAVGLDAADPDQPADRGLVAAFSRLAENQFREPLKDLADLLAIDEHLSGEDDPAEAVAILALLGVLDEDEDGLYGPEPVLAACSRLVLPSPVSA